MANILNEIANNWKLDAKLEDNERYFFHTNELDKIINGERCYVIGRKGTGKLALSEHLLGLEDYNVFSDKLNFKNFPFNELYDLHNSKYTPPNQYISIWKYIIYSFICRMFLKNENIDSKLRESLSKIYTLDPITSLARTVSNWTKREFGVNVLGSGANIGIERESNNRNEIPWQEKTDILEDILLKYIDECKYYVIFDELDEDYREVIDKESFKNYSFLLTSLFKAIQDIKSVFRHKKNNILPVIFLRDDIYKVIRDADKTKWQDYIVEIEWNIEKIKNLIAYRISKSNNEGDRVLDFHNAWNKLFSWNKIRVGTPQRKNYIESFEFITRNTHVRPRDFIKSIQLCAAEALSNKQKLIYPTTVKKVDRAFSNYLKSEIIDEVHAILPDIDNIFQVISQIRKWNFSVSEFKKHYNEYLKNGTIKEPNIDYVLNTLFHFSVIGNQDRKRMEIYYFKYLNKDATFNLNENIVVHRGLIKSLQIV